MSIQPPLSNKEIELLYQAVIKEPSYIEHLNKYQKRSLFSFCEIVIRNIEMEGYQDWKAIQYKYLDLPMDERQEKFNGHLYIGSIETKEGIVNNTGEHFNIKTARAIKRVLSEILDGSPVSNKQEDILSKTHPFTSEGSYSLFKLLDEKYITDAISKRIRYGNIFYYMSTIKSTPMPKARDYSVWILGLNKNDKGIKLTNHVNPNNENPRPDTAKPAEISALELIEIGEKLKLTTKAFTW